MNKKAIKYVAFVAFMTVSMNANAQFDLGSIVKEAAGSATKSSSTQSSTGGLLSGITNIFSSKKAASMDDLAGTWVYTKPAVVFTGNNILQSAGGKLASGQIENKLQTELAKVGIVKGKFQMTFDNAGNFTQEALGKTVKGTYTIDGTNINLKYEGQVKQVIGNTQLSGGALLIVMDATKLLSFAKTMGALSGNSTVSTVTSLAGSMKGMQCGLHLEKQ